jgi:hypothetical protein
MAKLVAGVYGAMVVEEELRGYGRAYKKAFGLVTGDIVVTQDGDPSIVSMPFPICSKPSAVPAISGFAG